MMFHQTRSLQQSLLLLLLHRRLLDRLFKRIINRVSTIPDTTAFVSRFDKWCDIGAHGGARTSRDWNEEFQQALSMPDSHAKFVALRNLELDFVYAAQLYGKIIISEMSLPVSLKTLKPSSVGGIAGGEKYIAQGILFKFAVDLEGLYKSDENAMKAASHDLKGLMAFFTTGVSALHVPLMALIDYKGFRLQAISLLPINKSTLAYGSSDGARTVHTSDSGLNECMRQAGVLLNLKPHRVGPNEIEIAAVADIEGHVGVDGRYYLLDFARVAPPQPVSQSDAGLNAQLYRLLRLEFVKRYVRPLSADAYSAMGRHNMREHNGEVREAFDTLAREVLPAFANKWSASVLETFAKRDTFEERLASLGTLCALAHAKGINVRLLGVVRASVSDAMARNLLLVEAVARVAKNSMRALLRREARCSGVPCRERFNSLALGFLNLCLRSLSDAGGEPFWSDLEAQAEHKFKLLFLRHDKTLPFVAARAQMSALPHLLLFHRIVQLLAIELDVRAVRELDAALGDATLGASPGFVLVQPDLLDQGVRTKHIGLVAYADAMQLFYSAQEASGDARLRLLTVARHKLDAARLSMVSDAMATYHLARTFQLMAECTADASERADLLERAAEVYVALRAERIEAGMNSAVVLEIAQIETTRVKLLRDKKLNYASESFAKAVLSAIDAWRDAVLLSRSRKANYSLAYLLLLCVRTGEHNPTVFGRTADDWAAFRDARALETHQALLLALQDSSANAEPSVARVHYRLFRLHYHLSRLNAALSPRTLETEQLRLTEANTAQQHLELAIASSATEVEERVARLLGGSAFEAWSFLRDIALSDAATRRTVARVCETTIVDVSFTSPHKVLFPLPAEAGGDAGVVPPLSELALRAAVSDGEQRASRLMLELCTGAKKLDLVAIKHMVADPQQLADALALSSPVVTSVTIVDVPLSATVIERWPLLESLDVSRCALTAAATAAIGALSSLRELRLRELEDANDDLLRAAIERPPLTLCDVGKNEGVSSALLAFVPASVTVLRIGNTSIDARTLIDALSSRLVNVEKLDVLHTSNVRDVDLLTWASTHTPLRFVRTVSSVPLWWPRGGGAELRTSQFAGGRNIRDILFGNEVALELRHIRTFAGTHNLQLVARAMFSFFEQGEHGDVVPVFDYTRSIQGQNRIEVVSKLTGERTTFSAMVGAAGMRGMANVTMHGKSFELHFNASAVNIKPGRTQTSLRENNQQVASFDTMTNKFEVAKDIEVVTAVGLLVAGELLGKAL
jgi:hypothetical protein